MCFDNLLQSIIGFVVHEDKKVHVLIFNHLKFQILFSPPDSDRSALEFGSDIPRFVFKLNLQNFI